MLDEDYTIVICGAAGQGIKTVEQLLTKTLKRSGYNVFATREYMSRVRGGVNSTSIRVSSNPVRAFVKRIDILIPLNEKAYSHLEKRISPDTFLIGEDEYVEPCLESGCKEIEVPFEDLASELGGKIYSNIVAVGVVCSLFNADKSALEELLRERFKEKGGKVINDNIKAAKKGYSIASNIEDNKKQMNFKIQKSEQIRDDYILDGKEAVALGAIAGGANFVAFYPMAPSTGIGEFLAQQALNFSMIVDQSEDELSVINKTLGASYTGARSFVLTSGGGFSLMEEGVSLAGMTELPIVIHVGQRPGPATGMPTRTAQEDLNLVLNAGAGYFPRVIFAPGSIEDAFKLTQKAFNLTQELQVPVFILTDQYLIDSYYNLSSLNHKDLEIKKYFIKTDKAYKRYKFTEDGISPRGIPGYGEGRVDADSHTHTEDGDITEDPEIRSKTVYKRLKKLHLIKERTIPPELIGNENYKNLVISWGSNYYLIKESLDRLNNDEISFLFFKQVYPIHPSVIDYVQQAQKVITIENNPTGQFSNLIQQETQRHIKSRILNYTGYPFSIEELLKKINKFVEED